MSDQKEQKTYCNAITSAKEIELRDGEILKLGIKADKMIEFLNQHKNEKGYVNLVLGRRRTPSDYGDTHYAHLDTWKPSGGGQSQQPRTSAPTAQPNAGYSTNGTMDAPDDSQSVPF